MHEYIMVSLTLLTSPPGSVSQMDPELSTTMARSMVVVQTET